MEILLASRDCDQCSFKCALYKLQDRPIAKMLLLNLLNSYYPIVLGKDIYRSVYSENLYANYHIYIYKSAPKPCLIRCGT